MTSNLENMILGVSFRFLGNRLKLARDVFMMFRDGLTRILGLLRSYLTSKSTLNLTTWDFNFRRFAKNRKLTPKIMFSRLEVMGGNLIFWGIFER